MSDPFSIASGVVGIVSLGLEVVRSLYEYCSTLKDQSSKIARIHDNLSRLHDLLSNLRRQLDARRFRSGDIIILACIEGRILQCKGFIEELKEVADTFNQSQNDGLRAALKTKMRQATYPFQQSTLQKLEENVDNIFQQVFFSLQLLQNEDTSSIRNHVEDTKDLLEMQRANNVAKDIIKWLNAPDATTDFSMFHEKSQPGTGTWLINSQSFNTWLEQENSFMWLYGFAGCGKSILCSTVIQHVLQHRKSSQDIGVAFFFFAFDDTGKQDVSALLRALILQLSGQQGNISPSSYLSRLYASCPNSAPRNQALLDCLHQLSLSFSHTYIIIDALDESPRDKHRQHVLDVLTTVRGWMEPTIHLLVTGRDEIDIRYNLDPLGDESVAVRNEASDKDIALFRWVDCQLREMAVCPRTEEHLDRLLTSLPQTLDDTYERMLLAIPPAFQDYARQMLMLLCCAKRHLTVQELIYGMAVDLDPIVSNSDDTDSKDANSTHIGSGNLFLDKHLPLAVFKDKRKLHDADAVVEVCPGLIELYEGWDANREETLCVRIAHFSVQEYLKSDRIKRRENVAHYHMREQDMNTQATRICLAILDKFDESAALQANDTSLTSVGPLDFHIKRIFPWACYAANFWPDHFRENKEIPPEAVSAMLRLRPYALRISASYGGGGFFGYNPLQFATHYGLSSVVFVLLREPTTDINEIKCGTTALIIAAKARDMELVRCFLHRDADVNACDGGALMAAAQTGHVEMAKLLIDYGAEVNASGGWALQTAILYDQFEITQLLLEHGAEINAHGGRALTTAAETGHVKIAKLLLDHGAEVNASGGDYGAALEAAVCRGNLESAKLLLQGGADANLVGAYKRGRTPLWSAVASNELELIHLLLQYGAEVNHCDDYGETVLHKAVTTAPEDTVRLLIEHGAEVNIADIYGRTAILRATECDNENIAWLLLEKGADPNVVDRCGNTALSLAAKRGRKGMVTLLSNLELS
ncbi:hypothetical protein CGLO_04371 [Colletotrichum gloeosporioides Cg-14]|uniref:Uncharacterized protein n=1 Tax=Colletotrichum gloeosporioides (strain Cg-14) TaxID=1237896 RepID=T0KJM2_COLGC|nr:hypothetical protein CGLO_04371 [Colletotrichum gloeosporioides Cg-14]